MFWAEELAEKIIETRGKNPVLASGITPSGPIHLGNLREVMTANAIKEALVKLGAKPKLIYIADDFDRLRKVYPFLPADYAKYIGQPVSKIPDPEGCHENYALHFLAPFFKSLEELGVETEKLSATKMYEQGLYTDVIKTALENRAVIAKILEEQSGRQLDETWSPFEPYCKSCGRIDQGEVTEYDLENNRVRYKCECGHEDWADLSAGGGKLQWRIDWPARWKMLGVTVEQFGKEHGTVGGSYDTGSRISKEVYNWEPPFPVRYEFIYLKGSKGKMSSSLGNVVAAEDMLEIVPPQLVRYILYRTPVGRHIDFDPGQGLIAAVDEFGRLEKNIAEGKTDVHNADVYEYCKIKKSGKVLPEIPFRHLITAIQASSNNLSEIRRMLARTEHKNALADEEMLKEQIEKANNWLEKYAPEELKFSLQDKLPARAKELTGEQKDFLGHIYKNLLKLDDWNGDEIHKILHEVKNATGIEPKEAFMAIYIIFIDKNSGPQAGWFLGALDRQFVLERLKKGAGI